MRYSILGGGLSALSLAYFLQDDDRISEINIIEKENNLGGLCRSFDINGIIYDIGPHIIFSKDKDMLGFMISLLGENACKYRRSNKILLKNKLFQYPFENDLSKLDKNDLDYAVNSFINNPYKEYEAKNMLQFFLKTFSDGITNLYLRPYNEKIWKFDPSFMDIQMVERIPKPPKEDILRSSKGETIDGYLHQLYFYYPKNGGIEALISEFKHKLKEKVKINVNCEISSVEKVKNKFIVKTKNDNIFEADKIISTIPLNEFSLIYKSKTKSIYVTEATKKLKYNSIAIVIVNVRNNLMGENFAYMLPDKDIIFHRISKLDFMKESYHIDNTTTYMAEITYRDEFLNDDELLKQTIEGMKKAGFINCSDDVNFTQIKRFKYAYVIYDIEHKFNTQILKDYFKKEGIYLNGRFGTFEYINMDSVIKQSKDLAGKI